MEGARIRLVTTGKPDAEGRLKGVLDVELKPGWKTYWRDPGDAGVPPTIDVSANPNIVGAEFDFPAPQRHDEGDFKWAGYDYPIGLPVTFTLRDPAGPAMIDAAVFLGVCETICVPVQAKLQLDTSNDPDNQDDAAEVQAAFDALPGPEQPDFGVTLTDGSKDEVVVEAAFAGEPDAVDFFLAGSDGYLFGPPVKRTEGERLLFSVPILDRPEKMPENGTLQYTLVTSAGAVTGMLPYPPVP
jgi:DsbC/DsbD-like thiol-disulfide interchange protein